MHKTECISQFYDWPYEPRKILSNSIKWHTIRKAISLNKIIELLRWNGLKISVRLKQQTGHQLYKTFLAQNLSFQLFQQNLDAQYVALARSRPIGLVFDE